MARFAPRCPATVGSWAGAILGKVDAQKEERAIVAMIRHVLRESIRKGASQIVVRRDRQACSFIFEISGEMRWETGIPEDLISRVIERIGQMARLPVARRGETISGQLHLDGEPDAYFAVAVTYGAHACLRPITRAEFDELRRPVVN